MPNRWQYQPLAEPILTTPETSFLDKWWQPTSVPVRPKQQARTGFVVSPLEPTQLGISFLSSWAELPQIPGRRTYSQHGWFVIPWEPSLYIEPPLESWHRPQNIPPDKARRNPEGTFVLPWEPSLYTEPPFESWHRPTNVFPGKPRRNPEGWFASGYEVNLSWWMPTEVPPAKARRNPEGWFVYPWEPSLYTEPPLDSWLRSTEKPPDKHRRHPEGVTAAPLEPSLIIEPALESWHRGANEPVFRKWQTKGEIVLPPFFPPSVAEWGQEFPGPLRVKGVTPPSFFFVPVLEEAAVLYLDWLVQYDLPARKKAGSGGFFFVQAETPFEWDVPQSLPVKKRLVAPSQLAFVELVTPFDWNVPDSKVPVKKTTVASSQISFVELQTPIDWLIENQQKFPRERRQSPHGVFLITAEIPPPTVDGWWQPISVPVRRPLQLVWGMFVGTVLPIVPEICICYSFRTDRADTYEQSLSSADVYLKVSVDENVFLERIDEIDIVPGRTILSPIYLGRIDGADIYSSAASVIDIYPKAVFQSDIAGMRADSQDVSGMTKESPVAYPKRPDDNSGQGPRRPNDDCC